MNHVRNILLVDDEVNVVLGLQRFLRPYRRSWKVATASSGREALEIIDTQAFDLVVTDMRMPEMDGATFLSEAKERIPSAMRVVLSGQTDPDAAMRALPVAHQFLSKPTDPDVLVDLIHRLATDDSINQDVRAAIGRIDALPVPIATYEELSQLLSRENASKIAVVQTIEGAPAIAAKVLQLVNSAFFGVRREIIDVGEAVAYLGSDLTKTLVLSAGIVNNVTPIRATRFDHVAFQADARAVSRMARHLDPTGARSKVSFLAALLHDIGRLVVAYALPDVFDRAEGGGAELYRRSGAALLDLWGLPPAVADAVATFSFAPASATSELRAADVVYLAQRLIAEREHALESEGDRAYLATLGLSDRVAEWRAFATQLRRGS